MSLVTGILPQETFPQEDLSETNSGLLSLLLANGEILDATHKQASQTVLLYNLAHRAILEVTGESGRFNERDLEAFNNGITIYEAMGPIVRPNPPRYGESEVTDSILAVYAMRSESVLCVDALASMERLFRARLPKTYSTIKEIAQRSDPQVATPDYALYGAALSCWLERKVRRSEAANLFAQLEQ